MNTLEDQRIIDLYFNRNELAITETANKYGRLCFSIANNILRSQLDSDECVNDTYLRIWNVIPPTVPDCFRNFICRIVRNISLKRYEYNSAKKRSQETAVSLEELDIAIPDSSIPDSIDSEALGKAISDFLDTISRDARVVFIRKYFFFDSVSEIAQRFSFTENKVKVSLHRTREKLRTYLFERGIAV